MRLTGSHDPVLIVTGAPGAGKTTVARLLAGRAPRAVHLESDRFFHFIASGYVAPWERAARDQNTTVMSIVGDAAIGYARAGYRTIVDGILIPGWFFEPVHEALDAAGFDVAYAVLRPPLALALERARDRDGRPLSDPGVVEHLWQAFSDFGPLERHAIDIGTETAEEVAQLLEERLAAGALSAATRRSR